jgi:hypothetical protein
VNSANGLMRGGGAPVQQRLLYQFRVLSERTAIIARTGSRGMEFDCSRAPRRSQSLNRAVASFCAFENLARDVPTALMLFVAERQELTGPFQRNFHIGYHSRTKAVRDHDDPFPRLSLFQMQRVTLVSGSQRHPNVPSACRQD